jgi:hypothetical protein
LTPGTPVGISGKSRKSIDLARARLAPEFCTTILGIGSVLQSEGKNLRQGFAGFALTVTRDFVPSSVIGFLIYRERVPFVAGVIMVEYFLEN